MNGDKTEQNKKMKWNEASCVIWLNFKIYVLIKFYLNNKTPVGGGEEVVRSMTKKDFFFNYFNFTTDGTCNFAPLNSIDKERAR